MTVRELITQLQSMPSDSIVYKEYWTSGDYDNESGWYEEEEIYSIKCNENYRFTKNIVILS